MRRVLTLIAAVTAIAAANSGTEWVNCREYQGWGNT
jgi:hypothetical protein